MELKIRSLKSEPLWKEKGFEIECMALEGEAEPLWNSSLLRLAGRFLALEPEDLERLVVTIELRDDSVKVPSVIELFGHLESWMREIAWSEQGGRRSRLHTLSIDFQCGFLDNLEHRVLSRQLSLFLENVDFGRLRHISLRVMGLCDPERSLTRVLNTIQASSSMESFKLEMGLGGVLYQVLASKPVGHAFIREAYVALQILSSPEGLEEAAHMDWVGLIANPFYKDICMLESLSLRFKVRDEDEQDVFALQEPEAIAQMRATLSLITGAYWRAALERTSGRACLSQLHLDFKLSGDFSRTELCYEPLILESLREILKAVNPSRMDEFTFRTQNLIRWKIVEQDESSIDWLVLRILSGALQLRSLSLSLDQASMDLNLQSLRQVLASPTRDPSILENLSLRIVPSAEIELHKQSIYEKYDALREIGGRSGLRTFVLKYSPAILDRALTVNRFALHGKGLRKCLKAIFNNPTLKELGLEIGMYRYFGKKNRPCNKLLGHDPMEILKSEYHEKTAVLRFSLILRIMDLEGHERSQPSFHLSEGKSLGKCIARNQNVMTFRCLSIESHRGDPTYGARAEAICLHVENATMRNRRIGGGLGYLLRHVSGTLSLDLRLGRLWHFAQEEGGAMIPYARRLFHYISHYIPKLWRIISGKAIDLAFNGRSHVVRTRAQFVTAIPDLARLIGDFSPVEDVVGFLYRTSNPAVAPGPGLNSASLACSKTLACSSIGTRASHRKGKKGGGT